MNEENFENNSNNFTSDAPVIYRSDEIVEISPTNTKGKRFLKDLLGFVIVIAIVAVLVFGILYAVKVAAGYDTMGSLLNVIFEELIFIWKRIIKAE